MRSLLFSALLLALSLPAVAKMQNKTVEWKVGDKTFSGVLVYDDASRDKRPGLVMVPNWMGVTPTAIQTAEKIASDDYVVLVADVYGKGVRPKNKEEAGKLTQATYSDGGLMLRARMRKAVETLKAQSGKAPVDANKIGAFGFCFGGSAALELARSGSDVAGVVSLHGGLEGYRPVDGGRVRAPVLVLNGADDANVTDAHIAAFEKEMDAAKADWQFVNFSGAVHCFSQPESNDPPNCLYNQRAAKRAFRMMDDFFEERFD